MATRTKPARGTLYETDAVAWAEAQAEALRAGRFEDLDLEHLAEEIEDAGNRERDAVESHLETLVMHLLKWRYDPGHRSMSWHATIGVARSKIARRLRRSPSLRRTLPALLDEVYRDARARAAGETSLPYEAFPAACPFTLDQVTAGDWLPEE